MTKSSAYTQRITTILMGTGEMQRSQRARQQGFTLIELMVTLMVLVILLSVGIPSFTTWIKNNRLDTATRTIASALQLARNEAISRQNITSVRPGTTGNPGNWSNGVHIYEDTGASGNAYNAVNDLIKNVDANLASINILDDDPNNIISFSPTGLLNEEVNAQRSITLCHSSGEEDGAQITINSVGRTSISNIDDC